MPLTLDPGSIHQSFLSGDPAHVRSRLSHFSHTRSNRKQRNDLYRSTRKAHQLPEVVREFNRKNPDAHGIPRSYKIHFEEPTVEDKLLSSLNSTRLVFGQFGRKGGWLTLDGYQVDPDCLDFHSATNTYVFRTTLPVPVDGRTEQIAVSGHFNFDSDIPSGSLQVDGRVFATTLETMMVKFDGEVSADAGAHWSTANRELVWDEQSDAWKKASWESTMRFAYGIAQNDDPYARLKVIENVFTDKTSDPPSDLDLRMGGNNEFTCEFKEVKGKIIMETTVVDPKDAPEPRKTMKVKSVFPSMFDVEFSPIGNSFKGAYKDKDGNVYAVKGKAIDDIGKEFEDNVSTSLLSALASRDFPPPAKDIFSFLENKEGARPEQRNYDYYGATKSDELNIDAILNNNCMVVDPKDPSQYSDDVARSVMKDFYSIIVYYMDDDLRQTFISASPPLLAPEVKSIAVPVAGSDREKISTFYKKLQVPYLTSMLANSTVEEGKKCNGARAEKLLKTIPAEDPVYQSQSSALYRFRYLEKFPETLKFINDQNNKDYSKDIDAIVKLMKDNLRNNTKAMSITNKNYDKDLQKANGDIDRLGKWAKDRRLYWALRMLYYLEKIEMPYWYANYTTGKLASSIGMTIKQHNALFGVLERDQVNTAKDGINFMGAFNNAIRVFQMTTLIPQLVDADNTSGDLDSITKECLLEFWKTYKDSTDKDLAEQANLAKELYYNADMLRKFMDPLKKVQRLGGSAASWNLMLEMWDDMVVDSKWFKALQSGSKLFALVKTMTATALMILPLIPGFWANMSDADKTTSIIAGVALCATLVVKIAQGAVRLAYLWRDISTLKDGFKLIFGFEKVMDNISGAANKISGSFAKYFTRTAKQTLEIAGEENAISNAERADFSRLSKMFGRNMSELMGTVIGVTLAIASLVLTAISLSKEHDPLLIAADTMVMLSAAIQLLSIVAGWVVASGVSLVAGAVSALTLVATWGGPVAIAFALVGIIILIVWMSTHKPENPVEKFINDRVKPAKLYMDHLAIDYFNAIAATQKTASRVGISIKGAYAGGNEPASTDEQVYLLLKVKDEKSGNLSYTKNLDFTTATVWSLATDGYGLSQIYTQKSVSVTGPDGDQERVTTIWYLSVSDDEKEICVRRLPAKKEDEEKYKKELKLTKWAVDVVADPELDTVTKKPIKALCDISFKTTANIVKHFVLQSDVAKKAPIGFLLSDTARSTSTTRYVNEWLFELESLGPSSFEYAKNPWEILLTNMDESNIVNFQDALAVSSGFKWSITPALNSRFLELVESPPGQDEGAIRMKTGVKPEKMAKTTYTVTCVLMIDDKPHGQQSTTVDIAVVDKKEETKPDDGSLFGL